MTTKDETNTNAVRLYNLILIYREQHDRLPTFREMAELMDASSTSVISYYLRRLASWRWIEWTPGAARTLRLTSEELKKGMSFPDTYVILGNQRDKVKQVGNAVCPNVAQWIAERVVESLA